MENWPAGTVTCYRLVVQEFRESREDEEASSEVITFGLRDNEEENPDYIDHNCKS